MVSCAGGAQSGGMFRRTVALLLWAYFGWYLTATVADILGLPMALGPVGSVLMGALALRDWPALTRARFARPPFVPTEQRS